MRRGSIFISSELKFLKEVNFQYLNDPSYNIRSFMTSGRVILLFLLFEYFQDCIHMAKYCFKLIWIEKYLSSECVVPISYSNLSMIWNKYVWIEIFCITFKCWIPISPQMQSLTFQKCQMKYKPKNKPKACKTLKSSRAENLGISKGDFSFFSLPKPI